MIRYEFRNPTGDTALQLIELSRLWVEEGCSHGMIVNEAADLREPLAVALDNDRIVGYCFGHYYNQEKKTSTIPVGSTCFCVDELYVLQSYRSQGIGRKLYEMIEEEVSGKCRFITLTTSTKNYKAILKLYIEELGMCFHNAFLIKDLVEE